MADHQSLKVVEQCTVAPPSDSASPASLPLTFMDLMWLRFPPVERLFFYEIPSTQTYFFNTIVPKLKLSLSLILSNYLPLAGTLIWPQHSHQPTVQFLQSDGVSLTVAESGADFHYLSGDGFRKAVEFHPLVPKLPEISDERISVMALQVTLFQNVGFSIGITSHHAVLDGKTSTTFMNSWARVCNPDIAGGLHFPATESKPFYDRSVVNDSVGLEDLYVNDWKAIGGPNNRSVKFWSFETPNDLIRATFKLNRHDLQKLKQWALNKTNHISTFTVAVSYIWVCMAKAEGLIDGEMGIGILVDARPRLDPPLPMDYFGNCVSGCRVVAERRKLMGEDGVAAAMAAISNGVRRLEGGVFRGADVWVSAARSIKGGVRRLTVAGSPRFEVYGGDFGWGKPRKVEMISIDGSGGLCVSDSREGDGLEFGWVAETSVMESVAAHFAQGLEALS